jgi:nucleotide-binding universal stress UspA family protein
MIFGKEDSMSNVIVCGTDRSAGASRAASVASRLAEGLRREVALVHIDGEPPGMASITRARQLREMRRIADAHAFPRHAHVRIAGGEPARELARSASDLDAELLVIGSRGRHELASAVLGSVASELMRHAPCPVVVVPPDSALPSPELERAAIVCGVEGNDRDVGVLHLADDLRRRLRGTLHAVHAFDPSPVAAGAGGVMPPLMPELDETAHLRLSRSLRETGVEAEAAVVSLPPALALQRIAEEERAALIVLGCHGRGKVASVLLGSVAIQVAADAACPVVVLPPTAELAPGSGNYELARGAA